MDVVLLEFAKTFAKVNISNFLHKIKAPGTTCRLAIWLHGFQTGRVQSVVLNGYTPYEASVDIGKPQGSVLGPLFFLIHLGDTGKRVQDSPPVKEVLYLQKDLERVYAWAAANYVIQ